MIYQTFEPSTDLSLFIKCYWLLESVDDEMPGRQTIVPDGCMEMIFHLGDLYRQYLEQGSSIIQPRCFVIGQLTRPLEIEATGKTNIFAIRFHPEGFLPFATMPVKQMENTAVPLEKLFDPSVKGLEQKILEDPTTGEKIDLIETFLSNLLADAVVIDRVIKSTVDIILSADGQLSVGDLSEQTNTSRKQLERKFSAAVGLSPKQLSKTIRLQAALRKMLNGEFESFTALAYDGAYYDQAHFIKDFKEFTGFSPKEYFGENLKLSALFYK